MRVMGLDVGTKTIGVAMSDPMGWIAQGIKTIRRGPTDADCRDIKKMIDENEVAKIVVGLPLNMNGTEGPQAESVRKFVEEMKKVIPDTPVEFVDERLSTVAAERSLLEADMSRAKRKEVINHLAAAHVLQGYLDSQRPPLPEHPPEEEP
ncbi:MAG TPA: Holliday junction resolvase RuvX [bacterium]|nr:Holliday junction resolvase RuvX [bacterium]